MKRIITFITVFIFLLKPVFAYENSFDALDGIYISGGTFEITDNALKIETSGMIDLNIPISPISGGEIVISYKIVFGENGNTVIYLPAPASDGERIINPQLHKKTFAFPNGNTSVHNGTYTENVWHTVKFVVDTEMMVYSVYLDDVIARSSLKSDYVLTGKIDSINMSFSKGYVILDDLKIERTGDGGERTILFNSEYHADHTDKTIGTLPYNMKGTDFLKTLTLKSDCEAVLKSESGYIRDGDVLTVKDNLYDASYDYTLKVRTPNISTGFMRQFKQSLVLKENGDFCYLKGKLTFGDAYENGVVSKEILNSFGANADSGKTLSELEAMGLNVKTFGSFAVIRKLPLERSSLWRYDLEKLFFGGEEN